MGETENEEIRANSARDEARARRGTTRDHITDETERRGQAEADDTPTSTPDPAKATPGQLRRDQRLKGAR